MHSYGVSDEKNQLNQEKNRNSKPFPVFWFPREDCVSLIVLVVLDLRTRKRGG